MKINIINIILISIIALFVWLWLSKPTTTTTIIQNTKTDSLLKVIELNNIVQIKTDSIIDSLKLELIKKTIVYKVAVNDLKQLNIDYEKQIENINTQSITSDIEQFRANFLPNSQNN
jgi:hypothetical protein